MTRRRVLMFSVLVASAVVAVASLGRNNAYAERRRGPKKPQAEAAPADTPPATATIPKGLVTLRVEFRSKGKPGALKPTPWDGELTVVRGRIKEIRAWQDDPRNSVDGTSWKLTTRRVIPWNVQERKRGHKALPLADAALVIELLDVVPETELKFQTVQGSFEFRLKDVPFGARKPFLQGLVQVSRMANAATILSAPTEDDTPAAALAPDGKLYVAYVAFTHGKDFRKRPPLPKPPEDYGILAQPTGGDQVLLLCLDDDKWSGPTPVTPKGQDVYRTAVAVDGSGAVWVIWSAGRDANWDLYARSMKNGQWSKESRLTTDPGPDVFPVAATDSSGKVWVAWQAFRNGNSNILAIRQDGEGFGEPIVVADAKANQWAPAVTASSDGQVAVAWDSYENGNYDVFCGVAKGGQFGEPIPIATTLRAEMRASAAFDTQGRLWVAYEDAPEKWGKDWGALEKEGVALYQGRTVSVRVWAEGKLWRPTDDPINAVAPWQRKQKVKGRHQQLALPRLTAGADGRVWLAVRSPRLGARVGVGTAWFEHVAWYEADQWSGDIVCPGTDNILDSRPALLARPNGQIVLVGSTDGRFATGGRLPEWFIRQLRGEGEKIMDRPRRTRWPDPVNNELMMAEIGPVASGTARPAKLEPVAASKPAGPSPEAQKEANDVARARAARVTIGGKTLQLVRGEFHRHTEISQDGGGDGLLMDMWRYGIDAAGLDWIGNGDHDNGGGREYSWWITQKTTDVLCVPGAFSPMFSYERSCNYPDGHRNVVFAKRGVRTLPRLQGGSGQAMDDKPADAERPQSPDTQMLYEYLRRFDGVCASHTSGTDMGTDWRDNDAKVEPIVEIYQGCRQNYEMPGAPRSNTAENSIGGWRPFGFVSLALKKGYRLGFQSSSDHVSTHISYCSVWVTEPTRDAILASMKARHLYGATDNIIADVRCGDHFMGDEFATKDRPKLTVHLVGTQPFAKVHVVKDGNYAHTAEPNKQEVQFEWTDFDPKPTKTSYYYVRGEQTDGELVWVSPMWIRYQP